MNGFSINQLNATLVFNQQSRKIVHKTFSDVTKICVGKRILIFVQMLLKNLDVSSYLPNINIVYNFESDLRVLHD